MASFHLASQGKKKFLLSLDQISIHLVIVVLNIMFYQFQLDLELQLINVEHC